MGDLKNPTNKHTKQNKKTLKKPPTRQPKQNIYIMVWGSWDSYYCGDHQLKYGHFILLPFILSGQAFMPHVR